MLIWLAMDGIKEGSEYAVPRWRDELIALEPIIHELQPGQSLEFSHVRMQALKVAVGLGCEHNEHHLADERLKDDLPFVESLLVKLDEATRRDI
ncbi:hypothetical protein [uncultured Devosia sp.]|uniref:hypothetical protein n=1 Tax=uncultured Devosia sp. TaxID=211434 RepID=UPI0030EE69D8